jgi:hypothetical protein
MRTSRGHDLDHKAKLNIWCQTGDNEKHLVVFWVQTELTGKIAAMVVAHINQKPEWCWRWIISSWLCGRVSDLVDQQGLWGRTRPTTTRAGSPLDDVVGWWRRQPESEGWQQTRVWHVRLIVECYIIRVRWYLFRVRTYHIPTSPHCDTFQLIPFSFRTFHLNIYCRISMEKLAYHRHL